MVLEKPEALAHNAMPTMMTAFLELLNNRGSESTGGRIINLCLSRVVTDFSVILSWKKKEKEKRTHSSFFF